MKLEVTVSEIADIFKELSLFLDSQHRFLILRNGSVAGDQQHPFCTGLGKQQAVEWVF